MEQQNYYGNYATVDEALRQIKRLEEQGYTRDEISILAKDRDRLREVNNNEVGYTDGTVTDGTVVEQDAAAGAATGAALGGLGGLLAAAGALVIPGIGPILAAGPIATALAGAATGGLVGGALGGIVGALTESGIEESEAVRLNERFNEGDIIVYTNPKDHENRDRVVINDNDERKL